MSATGFSPLAAPPRPVAMIDLAGSWDDYWAARTSRWRNNVRRSEKLLDRQGAVEHVRHRPRGVCEGDGEPRWDLFDHCLEIAAASWQGGSQTGNTLSHPDVLPFLRDVHAVAARAGALDVNLLYVAGRPLAFDYAYHFAGYVFGLRTGYRPEPEHGGAGSVLQGRVIADSFARGDRFYDLGADYLASKRYWLSRVELSRSYAWFSSRAPRAQLLRAKRAFGAWRRRAALSTTAPSAPEC
jgi:CelD/BcsL family acetyltransferase involved in cellulose biosynthesis